MALKKQAKTAGGAPAWMVTYGDMMTLLLCFFVIIVAMSEIKKEEKFRQVLESIRQAENWEQLEGLEPQIGRARVFTALVGLGQRHRHDAEPAAKSAFRNAEEQDRRHGGNVKPGVGDQHALPQGIS